MPNLNVCNGDLLPRPLLQSLKELELHGGPPAQAGGHFFGLDFDLAPTPR